MHVFTACWIFVVSLLAFQPTGANWLHECLIFRSRSAVARWVQRIMTSEKIESSKPKTVIWKSMENSQDFADKTRITFSKTKNTVKTRPNYPEPTLKNFLSPGELVSRESRRKEKQVVLVEKILVRKSEKRKHGKLCPTSLPEKPVCPILLFFQLLCKEQTAALVIKNHGNS